MTNQTHYRKVFKSDHLGVADLEDFMEAGNKDLIFTVKQVRQEYGTKVAGKKIDANIAYFVENIKPLVLNAGNSKIMSDLARSKFVESWQNITIRLYIDRGAKLKGEVVGGVRISPDPVQKVKPVITDGSPLYKRAVSAYKRDGNFDKVLAGAELSAELQEKIKNEVS